MTDALDREIVEVTDRMNERLHRGSNEWKNLNDRERDIDAAMTLFGKVRSDRARSAAEIERLRAEVERLTTERDEAIAHDRQPYPTADAYELVCAARTKWQARAEAAEAERGHLRKALEKIISKVNGWASASSKSDLVAQGAAGRKAGTLRNIRSIARAALSPGDPA